MTRWAVAATLMAAALAGAPGAGADPEILEPYCSAGQVPTTGECKPNEAYIDDAPGADPDVAVGLDPETVPAV